MKPINLFVATLMLTCVAFFPGTARADDLDDLDVTMEVIDDIADIGVAVTEMRGPEAGGPEEPEVESDDADEMGSNDDAEHDAGAGSDDEEEFENELEDESDEEFEDEFEHDEDFDDEELDEEDDFEHEEGEDVEYDEYDEEDDAEDDGSDDVVT